MSARSVGAAAAQPANLAAMSRLPHVLFGGFALLLLASLIWPVYAWAGERIEPRILGLPFAFAWNVMAVVASFFALLWYDRILERRRRS